MYLVLHYTTKEGASVTPFDNYYKAYVLFDTILHDIRNDCQLTNEEYKQAQKELKIFVSKGFANILQLVEAKNGKTINLYKDNQHNIIWKTSSFWKI